MSVRVVACDGCGQRLGMIVTRGRSPNEVKKDLANMIKGHKCTGKKTR